MTGWDILKFDVRVRQRMMTKQLLTPAQLQRHLDELPDVEARCDIVAPQQPAVGTRGGRGDSHAGARIGVAPKAAVQTDAGNESATKPNPATTGGTGAAEVERSWPDEDLS